MGEVSLARRIKQAVREKEVRLLHHLAVGEEVETVAWAHLLGNGDGAYLPLDGLIDRLHLDTNLFDDETH